MPARISKVTLVLDTWNSEAPPVNGRYPMHRVSFDVPRTDAAFYDWAMEVWHDFSLAVWDGKAQFNEVAETNDPVVG